jgi:hypothetical protein
MRCSRFVTRGRRDVLAGFWWGNQGEGGYLEIQAVEGNVILK